MSETLNPRRDYFEYLENVLGIKTILQEPSIASFTAQATDATPVMPAATATELLFCVQNYTTYTAEEVALLHKMIAAVKVAPERLRVCDWQDAQKFEAPCLVVFADAWPTTSHADQIPPQRAWQLVVQTFSPRVLLQKPELKKQAWIELQKVLSHFA